MIPLVNPTSHYDDDYHSHDFFTEEGDHVCTIEFDAIEESRKNLDADCIVTWHLGSKDAMPVIMEQINLMARTGNSALAQVIKRLAGDNAYLANWQQGFDTAVYSTIMGWRGSASDGGFLDVVVPTVNDAPFLLRPWISSVGTTVLFAPPGSNKSMFCMWMGIHVARNVELWGQAPQKHGPVLYVDFEDERAPHEFRFSAMLRSLGVEDGERLIYHERVTRNLRAAKRRIRKLVRDLGCPLVIVDSISRARGSDVSSSEATVKLFEMFSQFGVPVLAVDHMTKEENKRVWTANYDAREAQPLGSGVTQNTVRLGWMMNVLPGATDQLKKYNLYNTKHNHVAEQATVGLTFRAESDEWGTIYNAEFSRSDREFFVEGPKKENNKAVQMLRWHLTEQRKDGAPFAFTGTMIAAGSGVGRSTVVTHLRDAGWWVKLSGSAEYRLSDLGMEQALIYGVLG